MHRHRDPPQHFARRVVPGPRTRRRDREQLGLGRGGVGGVGGCGHVDVEAAFGAEHHLVLHRVGHRHKRDVREARPALVIAGIGGQPHPRHRQPEQRPSRRRCRNRRSDGGADRVPDQHHARTVGAVVRPDLAQRVGEERGLTGDVHRLGREHRGIAIARSVDRDDRDPVRRAALEQRPAREVEIGRGIGSAMDGDYQRAVTGHRTIAAARKPRSKLHRSISLRRTLHPDDPSRAATKQDSRHWRAIPAAIRDPAREHSNNQASALRPSYLVCPVARAKGNCHALP